MLMRKPFSWQETAREIKIGLPGFGRDEIKVLVEKGFVRVSAEKKGRSVERRKGFYKEEAFRKSFSRSMSLPDGMRPEDLDVRIEDGSVSIRKKARR